MSGVVQGLGLGLIFVPLQSLAFETLAPRMRTTAAALLNLSRNIGGSVGISVVSTQLVRMTQVAHADLAHNITEQTIPTLDPTVLQTDVPGRRARRARLHQPGGQRGRRCSSPISTTSS